MRCRTTGNRLLRWAVWPPVHGLPRRRLNEAGLSSSEFYECVDLESLHARARIVRDVAAKSGTERFLVLEGSPGVL